MSKLLIDVFVPGNGKTYEFQIDSKVAVYAAVKQIIGSIIEVENETLFIDIENAVLSDINASKRLEPGLSLQAQGVKSGHKMILL